MGSPLPSILNCIPPFGSLPKGRWVFEPCLGPSRVVGTTLFPRLHTGIVGKVRTA